MYILAILLSLLPISVADGKMLAGSSPTNIIMPLVVPSRTSGVAPLLVIFDGSGTTAYGLTSDPFHDVGFAWNFDDPAAGTWAYGVGNTSKNAAYGPLSAHVFETPGTYTVTLTARYAGLTASMTVVITVSDPEVVFASPSTYCITASGSDFTGCPISCPSAQCVTQSSWSAIVNTYALAGKRVLLKRGDIFQWSGTAPAINNNGPGIIGAFGSGAKPKLQASSATAGTIAVNVSGSDWRIVDVTVDPNGNQVGGWTVAANAAHVLVLRMDGVGLITAGGMDNGCTNIGDVDSTYTAFVAGPNNTNGMYISGPTGFALMGTKIDDLTIDDTKTEHVLRTQRLVNGIISNNSLSRPNLGKTTISIRGNDRFATQGVTSRQIIVSDNILTAGSDPSITSVWVSPQNGGANEPIFNVIVERNFILGGTHSGGGTVVEIRAAKVSFRDNIIKVLSTGGTNAVALTGYSVTNILSQEVWVYGNSIYMPSVTGQAIGVTIGELATPITVGIVVGNNLVYSPNASSTTSVRIQSGSSATTLTNTSDSDMKNTSPQWVNGGGSFDTPSDFALSAGSYAVNAGTNVPTWIDAFLTNRPTDAYDIGAVER